LGPRQAGIFIRRLDALNSESGRGVIFAYRITTEASIADRTRRGAVTRTEFGRAQYGSPSSGSGRGGGSPRLERFFSEDVERVAGGEMALDVEGVENGGVNGQQALG